MWWPHTRRPVAVRSPGLVPPSRPAATSRSPAWTYAAPNLDLIRDGKVTALVAQPIYEEFGAAVQAIADHICGVEVEYSNRCRPRS